VTVKTVSNRNPTATTAIELKRIEARLGMAANQLNTRQIVLWAIDPQVGAGRGDVKRGQWCG
jgi:hypothetical protein